jgi:TPR repeat protein
MDARTLVSSFFLSLLFTSSLIAQPRTSIITSQPNASKLINFQDGSSFSTDQLASVKRHANFGDTDAQVQLGYYIAQQKDAPGHDQQAFQWFQRAALDKSPAAMNNLAIFYLTGRGVKRDFKEGLLWLNRAAECGFAPAELNVGLAHWYGWGMPVDHAEAVHWFRRAAKHGDPVAQFSLGFAFEEGAGVKQSFSDAAHWYEKAAHQGHPDALNNLGVLYENGRGVDRDYLHARELFEHAIKRGNFLAGTNLARIYYEGLGVQRDIPLACSWLTLATPDYPAAEPSAQKLCGVLSDHDRQISQQRAEEWRRNVNSALRSSSTMAMGRLVP